MRRLLVFAIFLAFAHAPRAETITTDAGHFRVQYTAGARETAKEVAIVAEEVYYQRRPAKMPGVLHFHATYVQPDWSKERQRVSRIGRHVFYR